MQNSVLAVVLAAALSATVAAPAAIAQYVQAVPVQPEKKLTPQQQKLKDCGAKWQQMKRENNTQGKTWPEFRRECLKAS
jgi:hypothetical protein